MGILNSVYPTSHQLKENLKTFNDQQKRGFIRLWISEGIPHFFQDKPLVYEEIRDYIAQRLHIHQKEITLIGSARIGISLSSPPKFGLSFSEDSDFDFSVVSSKIFTECTSAFVKWQSDYLAKAISSNNETEAKHWAGNNESVPKNIRNGFIDPYKIPNRGGYQIAQKISQLCFELQNRFNIRKPSIRIYNSWDSFVEQCIRNLNYCISHKDF